MAYCRCDGKCKVYMYRSVTGKYCFNIAGSCREVCITEPEEALRKLKDLKIQGLGVPNYAIERLKDEIKRGIHSN